MLESWYKTTRSRSHPFGMWLDMFNKNLGLHSVFGVVAFDGKLCEKGSAVKPWNKNFKIWGSMMPLCQHTPPPPIIISGTWYFITKIEMHTSVDFKLYITGQLISSGPEKEFCCITEVFCYIKSCYIEFLLHCWL